MQYSAQWRIFWRKYSGYSQQNSCIFSSDFDGGKQGQHYLLIKYGQSKVIETYSPVVIHMSKGNSIPYSIPWSVHYLSS